MTINERNVLIEQHLYLAYIIAASIKKTLPNFFCLEDLISAAYLGLVEAANKYDVKLGVLFSTFVSRRMRGAVMDEIRQISGSRKGQEEVRFISLDASSDGSSGCLKDFLESRDSSFFFKELIEALDPLAQKVLSLYYVEGRTMADIAKMCGMSQPGISQLLKRSRAMVRSAA